MKDEQLREEPFPIIWDDTMRRQAAQCKRKLYFFLRRFDYAAKPPYFTFGNAWQAILDHWYMQDAEIINSPGSEVYNLMALKSLKRGEAVWDAESPEPNADNRRENLKILWDNYLKTYPKEGWRMLEREIGFEWPIMGTDYFYAGALDGRIEWKEYGILAFEDKTEGSYLSRSVLDKYLFRTQQTGQVWYIYQQMGEMPFGCLVNCVTKKIPGPTSKWTTNRCERIPVRKSKAKLDSFIEDLLWEIEDFKRCWNKWHFPMTSDEINCVGGVAKAPCLFKPVCLSGGDPAKVDVAYYEGIIERTDRWEPWKRK